MTQPSLPPLPVAMQVAVRLQDMLAEQQKLAQQYREQARRSLEQLRQMGLPPPSADAGSGGLAPASMFRELQELRASEEQKRRMLAAAALVVS